jgi:hypothetical protein
MVTRDMIVTANCMQQCRKYIIRCTDNNKHLLKHTSTDTCCVKLAGIFIVYIKNVIDLKGEL